ncbi:MAG TPA: hypothetical protein VF731_11470 [Solirubrobacterales bacterium]
MSILDDAIREHLELKRAHGADAEELKKLEDEAFGPPQRPDEIDPFAEAPTEFLGAPGAGPEAETTITETGGRRVPNIADLQEAPEMPTLGEDARAEMPLPEAATPPPEAPESEAPDAAEAEAPAPPEDEGPPTSEVAAVPEAEATPAPEPPAVEEQPVMEHEAVQEPPAPPAEPEPPAAEQPPADAGPSTEERHAIAEQPTQFFDVEAEMEEPAPPAESPTPSDEQLADAEAAEPRLGATPPASAPAPEPELADEAPSEEYEEDDFFSEQRLSEELDQALEAPVTDEQELPRSPSFFDQEKEAEPISEEYEQEGEFETGEEEHATGAHDTGEHPTGEHDTGEEEHEHPAAHHEPGHEDVLEDKPDFLEDDEDDVWFEQRPPKDFDFDD